MMNTRMHAPKEGEGGLAFDHFPRPPADTAARFAEYLRARPSPHQVAQELVLGFLGSLQARVAVISSLESDATVRLIGGFGQPAALLESLGTSSLWDDLPNAQAIRYQKGVALSARQLFPQVHDHEGAQQTFVAVPLVTNVSVIGSVCVGVANQMESVPLAVSTLESLVDIYVLYLLAHMSPDTEPIHRGGFDTSHIPPTSETLSGRQIAVLELLGEGMTYNQIATRIGYSHSTVRMELMQVYRTFGVSSRREAVRVGIARGLVQPPVASSAALGM